MAYLYFQPHYFCHLRVSGHYGPIIWQLCSVASRAPFTFTSKPRFVLCVSLRSLSNYFLTNRAPLHLCAAGVFGGIACVYAGHPFDTLKVKMQTSAHLYPKGAVDCFMQTLRSGGIRGLYAGATPSLVANVGENGT